MQTDTAVHWACLSDEAQSEFGRVDPKIEPEDVASSVKKTRDQMRSGDPRGVSSKVSGRVTKVVGSVKSATEATANAVKSAALNKGKSED
jgi:hypothetical protein